MLAFAHIGDLHIVDARQSNARDFLAIVAQLAVACGDALDFVVLPGDNADNGLVSQYRFIATALKMLSVPIHIIPGDHDMEQGSLANLQHALDAAPLPKAVSAGGVRALFLDLCGGGDGGPDFRLGRAQIDWLAAQLDDARARGETTAIFMHTYPADLRGADEPRTITELIARSDVALVDMGHTHYNEIANDGRTIYTATRSTGQIEEGPVGYTLATIDGGVVSWRFKLLDEPFPFVLITSPADHRLLRGNEHVAMGHRTIRALVLGAREIERVDVRIDEGQPAPMRRDGDRGVWVGEIDAPASARFKIAVTAHDETGRPGTHVIEAAGAGFVPRPHRPVGSDAASIGAWPENGIFGTQLGPNRNGKPLAPKPSAQRSSAQRSSAPRPSASKPRTHG